MEDRELVELAAKAAGIKGIWHRKGFVAYSGWSKGMFNPLADDGDALRLASYLELEVSLGQYGGIIYMKGGRKIEEISDDYMSAIRRSIVRAAAEIGKEME